MEQDEKKQDKKEKEEQIAWYKSLPQTLCLIGVVVLFLILAFVSFKETPMSPSDSILLVIIGIIASAGISFYLTKHFSYGEALKRVEGEAIKALRRIVSIKESTLRLQANCSRISDVISLDFDGDEKKLLLEYFHGIRYQLADLHRNVNSSIDDWRDYLPDKVGKLIEAEKKQYEIIQVMEQKLIKLQEDYKKDLETAKEGSEKLLKEELDKNTQVIRLEFHNELAKAIATSPYIRPPNVPASLGSSGTSGISGTSGFQLPLGSIGAYLGRSEPYPAGEGHSDETMSQYTVEDKTK